VTLELTVQQGTELVNWDRAAFKETEVENVQLFQASKQGF
jgi:hypothetical protein